MHRGGVLRFYSNIQAKNSALYIDFDLDILFGGGGQQEVATSRNRTFTSTNPMETQKYLAVVKQYWSVHHIFKHIPPLHHKTKLTQSNSRSQMGAARHGSRQSNENRDKMSIGKNGLVQYSPIECLHGSILEAKDQTQ